MTVALPSRQLLKSVYRPGYENADGGFLPYTLGMINISVLDNPATIKYRKQRNPGGTLGVRAAGETIKAKGSGLNYIDEEAGLIRFGDGRKTGSSEIFGQRNPETLNPEDAYDLAIVARDHMDELMAAVSNTARLYSSLAFVPSVTIDGVSFSNSKIIQEDITGTGSWSDANFDIVNYLVTKRRNFFGNDLAAGGITVMISPKQVDNISKNLSVQKTIGFDDSAFGTTPSWVIFEKVQRILAGFGVYVYEWNDTYYNTNNSEAYSNLSTFLPADYISIVPNTYAVRTPGNPSQMSLVSPQSPNNNPFVDFYVVPDPEFMNKTVLGSRGQGGRLLNNGMINGAYFYQGFPYRGPEVPDSFETYVATMLGLFTAIEAAIRYVKVS